MPDGCALERLSSILICFSLGLGKECSSVCSPSLFVHTDAAAVVNKSQPRVAKVKVSNAIPGPIFSPSTFSCGKGIFRRKVYILKGP